MVKDCWHSTEKFNLTLIKRFAETRNVEVNSSLWEIVLIGFIKRYRKIFLMRYEKHLRNLNMNIILNITFMLINNIYLYFIFTTSIWPPKKSFLDLLPWGNTTLTGSKLQKLLNHLFIRRISIRPYIPLCQKFRLGLKSNSLILFYQIFECVSQNMGFNFVPILFFQQSSRNIAMIDFKNDFIEALESAV